MLLVWIYFTPLEVKQAVDGQKNNTENTFFRKNDNR